MTPHDDDLITTDEVLTVLGFVLTSPLDEQWLDTVTGAANAFITRARPDLVLGADVREIRLGLAELAARWYRRRGNDAVAAFDAFSSSLPAIDRDIEIKLGIGRAAAPVIA